MKDQARITEGLSAEAFLKRNPPSWQRSKAAQPPLFNDTAEQTGIQRNPHSKKEGN